MRPIFLTLVLVVSWFLGHSSHAASFTVTNTTDASGTCAVGNCSLRQAIASANLDSDADTIGFDPTVFATSQTLDLGADSPDITNSVTITGSAAGVTLLTKDTSHGFECTSGTVNFIALTLTGHNNNDFGIVCRAATVTVRDCTFTNYGYGIETFTNNSPARVQNCTFSGNAHAIYAGGPLSLENSTLSGNTYGLYILSSVTAKNSIVAGNTTDITNLQGSLTSNYCLTNMTAAQAGLDPAGLKNNGGPTQTFALNSSGPAYNTGDPAFDSSALPNDQRGSGYARKAGGTVDIGAYEIQENAPTALVLSGNTVASGKPVGTFIGTFSSTDADVGDAFTYTFVSGAGGEDNAAFSINAAGSLRTAVSVNAAVKSSYSILVKTTDTGGLSLTKSFTITVLEATPPTITISSPTTNQKLWSTGFSSNLVGGTAGDNVGVSAVKIRLSRKRNNVNQYWNGSSFITTSVYVDAAVTGTASATWKLTNVPPASKLDAGAYQVEAYALDAAGNKSATAARPFTVMVDNVQPTVSLSTPTVNQIVNINNFGAGTITGTAGDDYGVASVKLKLQRTRSGVTTYWNGSAFTSTVALVDATVSMVGGTSVSWSLNTPIPANQLDAGAYTVYATAYDAAGNFLTTPSRGFFVNGKANAAASSSRASGS